MKQNSLSEKNKPSARWTVFIGIALYLGKELFRGTRGKKKKTPHEKAEKELSARRESSPLSAWHKSHKSRRSAQKRWRPVPAYEKGNILTKSLLKGTPRGISSQK